MEFGRSQDHPWSSVIHILILPSYIYSQFFENKRRHNSLKKAPIFSEMSEYNTWPMRQITTFNVTIDFDVGENASQPFSYIFFIKNPPIKSPLSMHHMPNWKSVFPKKSAHIWVAKGQKNPSEKQKEFSVSKCWKISDPTEVFIGLLPLLMYIFSKWIS